MPQIQHISTDKNCHLILWRITEEVEQLLTITNLSKKEREQVEGFGSSSRKKEFLVSRIMVQSLLGRDISITHNSDGKPLLQNSDYDISISHTKDMVGVILAKGFDIALDIEYFSSRIEKIYTRFLSSEEQKNICSKQRLLHLYQHWCAKECLIKLMGKKDLHLTKELIIHPFTPEQKTFSGTILRNGKNYLFNHQETSNYILVYCCQPRSN